MKTVFQINSFSSLKVNENGDWLLETERTRYPLEDGKYSLFLLPLLEHDFSDFISTVKKNDDFSQSLPYFPMLPLLKHPFKLKMEYWAGLSLNWIEQGNWGQELKFWAEEQDRDWMPQKLKHRFLKVFKIRSWRK